MRKLTNKEKAEMRLGESRINTNGSMMTIVEYVNFADVTVEFVDTGELIKTTYGSFKSGKIRSKLDKCVYGRGYVGIGDYLPYVDGKITSAYTCWQNMMKRAYSVAFKDKQKSYEGVTVCDEWHNFQVFAKFYEENYYELENDRVELDKDLLVKDNKVYSPSTCVFIPQRLNTLLTGNRVNKGVYPVGVNYHKATKKFAAQCRIGIGSPKYLGLFNTPMEAFAVYKEFKESIVKEISEQYEKMIPQSAYTALINFTVKP